MNDLITSVQVIGEQWYDWCVVESTCCQSIHITRCQHQYTAYRQVSHTWTTQMPQSATLTVVQVSAALLVRLCHCCCMHHELTADWLLLSEMSVQTVVSTVEVLIKFLEAVSQISSIAMNVMKLPSQKMADSSKDELLLGGGICHVTVRRCITRTVISSCWSK